MLIVCFSKVRQGLLFAISMVYLAVPPVTLLNDLQNEVFESKIWLQGIHHQLYLSLKLCQSLHLLNHN